ncbi:SRPBCC domain-containing protein [Paenarthrobacter sp. NPDC058040]|uniref:SRPBCC domain-containing protein n=1 Tax=unclassified Paenarthrobacter TaxID=2634190 RepID=UPI0036DAFECD
MITIAQRVSVPHPPELVWSILSDPHKVVGCIDGSRLGEFHDDGSFDALMAVRFAAIKVSFKARANLVLDEEARTGRLEAKGSDSRGSTRVQGHADYSVVADGDGSLVILEGQIDIGGALASLITTGASIVVDRMTKSFTESLIRTCATLDPNSETAEPAADRKPRLGNLFSRVGARAGSTMEGNSN